MTVRTLSPRALECLRALEAPTRTARRRRTSGTIAAATAANLAMLLLARAAGASMTVDPAFGHPDHRIGPGAVVAKTTIPLAVSAVGLSALGRRSGAALAATTAVGAGLIALSIAVVSGRAHDVPTAVACSALHGVVGLSFVHLGRLARPGPGRATCPTPRTGTASA